jgi:uncharacterized protein (UPF0303 family)
LIGTGGEFAEFAKACVAKVEKSMLEFTVRGGTVVVSSLQAASAAAVTVSAAHSRHAEILVVMAIPHSAPIGDPGSGVFK